MSNIPIADHALLSDCHSTALVDKRGSIEWLCFPRFDSPSIFARLLDDGGGHWSICPTEVEQVSRSYHDKTMVLETRFATPTGTVVVTDAMAVGPNARGHDLGLDSPHIVVRRLECTEGEVRIEVEFSPRPEYGLIAPLMRIVDGGVEARGGAELLTLSGDAHFTLDGTVARADFDLRSGEETFLGLQHRSSSGGFAAPLEPSRMEEALDDTITAWRTWSDLHQGYEGPWQELVHHSGRVLYALTYRPTGAICAAATTSLPETEGGERNWDYRYAWVRDASFTLDALWVAACPDEAHEFFSYMTGAAASQIGAGEDLQIMFGVGGEHDLTERILPHLEGWRESRPVRIGNGAWTQRQLDVYGELLDAAHRLIDQLGELDDATKSFLVAVADMAAQRWHETDQGIWEVRGPPRHYLYSKLMCWVALDRAVDMAGLIGGSDRVERWIKTRDEIRDAILQRGFNKRVGAFTQTFGGDELDASNLMIPIVGFLPADDPKMESTIRATEDRLTDDRGLVFRYLAGDGLAGEEGTFLLCTFWLAEAQALAGDLERARATFERAAAFANDVGLLAEEVDPSTGELLGNFPQAFSHIGLVNAAWAISQA